MNSKFEEQLYQLMTEDNIHKDELLSKHTTFKIGGPADYFITPSNKEEVQTIISLCQEYDTPFYIIGNGSNLLVGDKGYRGVIIQLYKNYQNIVVEEKEGNQVRFTASAGVLLSALANEAAKQSCTGFEFASGIPGTLGGAVTMNAGAYGGEIKDCIEQAVLLDEDGNFHTLNKEQLELGYRSSIIQKKSYIVLEASFIFEKGNQTEIYDKMKELNQQRRDKQPLEYPSAGSTFKRPKGYFAGKLIMDAGLKGYRVGDAMVSEKHCGFVINAGKATAADVKKLIQEVDRIVYEKNGVHLEPEVRMIGEF